MIELSSLPWSVTHVKSNFVNHLGHIKTTIGTGFWLCACTYRRKHIFVTNKHNIDPLLKVGSDYKLDSISIKLRKLIKENQSGSSFSLSKETAYFEVANLEESIYSSESADCSIIFPVELKERPADFKPFTAFRIEDIAGTSFFNNSVNITDYCHFVGFPGNNSTRVPWWDHSYSAPISRFASIASNPVTYLSFEHPNINTSDIVLVSGLSFSGSSGSPVILDQKGVGADSSYLSNSDFIKVRCKNGFYKNSEILEDIASNLIVSFEDKNFVPRRLIGIMTGHLEEEGAQNHMHSGLSYFTRTTSLFPLIQKAGFEKHAMGHFMSKNFAENSLGV